MPVRDGLLADRVPRFCAQHHDKKDDKKGGWHEEPKAYVKKAKRADAPAGPRRQPAEQ